MKKLLIVILVLIACNLISEEIHFGWTGSPDGYGITHYDLYKAESNDSANFNLVYVGSVQHTYFGDTLYFNTTLDFDYVKAGVTAVTPDTFSIMTISRVYTKRELFPPIPPPSPAGFFVGTGHK